MTYLLCMLTPTPTTMVGRTITLEPLATEHAADLFANSDEGLFANLLQRPFEWTLDEVEKLIARMLSQPRVAFAIRQHATRRIVGSTSYLNIRMDHGGLEIGTTWISRPLHGTTVNPESKLAMLGHAIETLGAVRVEFLVSVFNLHSQAAVTKLGAVREGVLRNRWQLPSGKVVDAVCYSVVPEDWPRVKAGLKKRVGES
mgnify:CR=1 FL=1